MALLCHVSLLPQAIYLDVYTNTPKVFLGLVRFTGIGFLPLLDDTIDSVLRSIDLYSSKILIFSFVRILHSIVCLLYNTAVDERKIREQVVKEKPKEEEGTRPQNGM